MVMLCTRSILKKKGVNMGGGSGGLVRAAIGLGTLGLSEALYYQPKSQAKAQQQATDAQRNAEMEARRIAASKKPMEESATLKTNALDAGVDPLTSLNLLIDPAQRPKKPTGLGTPMSSTGLGFGN